MPEAASEFPAQAAGKIRQITVDQMAEAKARFGVTPGALVRMALEDYMPRYLAAQGRTEHMEFLAFIGATLGDVPDLKPALEKFLREKLRGAGTVKKEAA